MDINWELVETAIGEEEDFLNFDYEQIKDAVYNAAENWLPQDADKLIIGIEEEVEVPFEGWEEGGEVPEQARRAKGVIDLILLSREGKLGIVDWKTCGAQALPETEKYTKSWQWRMYVAAWAGQYRPEDIEVQYRVVSRGLQLGTISLQPTEFSVSRVREYMQATAAMNDALAPFTVWPQRMPGACKAFGRQCPYEADCHMGTMPRGVMPRKDLSFSYLERFLLCPERARRAELEPDRDGSEEAGFGSAFHRGIAEVYRQVKEGKC